MARKDGLPEPVTVGDAYLAAILDEIRGLRDDQRPQVSQVSDSVRVKEIGKKR